jgi:SAM-dependent methyltransferase
MLKRFVKRRRWTAIVARIGHEGWLAARRRLVADKRGMGSTHRHFDLEGSVDYIDIVYEDYRKWGGLDAAAIEGASVLEVGPGDSFGVALRFLADGAARVVAIDRFVTFRDSEQQRRIYRLMRERLGAEQRERLAEVLSEDGTLAPGERLRVIEGVPIEAAPASLGTAAFDLIVSRAVMEHVLDLDSAFDAMDSLLRRGGRMAHEVDLRDHDIFSAGGQHPLTFLTVSDWVYRLMGASGGQPNRRLVDYYRDVAERLGYDASVLVTHVAGEPEADAGAKTRVRGEDEIAVAEPLVEAIRPRLLSRFRGLSSADLAVSGIFLAASKPA